MDNQFKSSCLALATAFFLSGCGGGSSSSQSENINNLPPSISMSDQTVEEKSQVSLSATVSDPDGSIASYMWTQTSGESVVLNGSETNTLSFTAPSITSSTELLFQLKVTDNNGAASTEEVTVIVTPNIVATITLDGKVTTGSPIANANVTATVGHSKFETQSNELGDYALEISIDDDDVNGLFTLSATGPSSNSVIKLVSHLGETQDIVAIAQDNGNVLTSNEHVGVKINHFTTAAASLLAQRNDGQQTNNVEQYNEAIKQIDTTVFSRYAMMLQYLAENMSNLPEQFSDLNFENTYQLFSDKTKATQLFYTFNQFNDSLIDDLMEETVSNLDSIDGSFDIDVSKAYYSNMGKLSFASDYSGYLTSNHDNLKHSFKWGKTLTGLELFFTEPFLHKELSIYQNGNYYDVNAYIHAYELKIINQDKNHSIILVQSERTFQDISTGFFFQPVEEQSYGFFDQLHTNVDIENSDILKPNEEYYVDVEWVEPNYYNSPISDIPIEVSAVKINSYSPENKNVMVETVTSKEFDTLNNQADWRINSDDELEIDGRSFSLSIAKIQGTDPEKVKVATINEDQSSNKVSSRIGTLYKVDKSLSWSAENVPGTYEYNFDDVDLNPLNTGWYELRSDGTLSYFSLYGNDVDKGNITTDSIFESPGLWRIVDNEVVIRRYRYNHDETDQWGTCHSSSWETTASSECILYMERRWKLIQKNTSQNVVIQKVHYYLDYVRSGQDPYNQVPLDEHIYWFIDQRLTDFDRHEDRPVDLPEDYVLIKDREVKNSSSALKSPDVSSLKGKSLVQ